LFPEALFALILYEVNAAAVVAAKKISLALFFGWRVFIVIYLGTTDNGF
jgi:hypothetical protein